MLLKMMGITNLLDVILYFGEQVTNIDGMFDMDDICELI